MTTYVRLDRASVRRGERVAQRELIGRAGSMGSCTGVELRFRVWVDGEPTDPQLFLGNRVRLRG